MKQEKNIEDLILRCKQLPAINCLEDISPFYKKLYELKLHDVHYLDNIDNSFERKEISVLDLQGVLTSYTMIQRDEYWHGGYGSVYKESLNKKYFEKLYNRLQELIKEESL